MSIPEQDREVLTKFLTSLGSHRRRAGIFLCLFGLVVVLVQIWSISGQLTLARQHDEILSTLSEVGEGSLAKAAPVQTSVRISLNIVLSVANALIGLFLVLLGAVFLVRTPATRVLEVLARQATRHG